MPARSAILQCHWKSWVVTSEQSLALNLPAHNYPDMGGVTRTAEALMPDVVGVEVLVDGVPDTAYFRDEKGEWRAVPIRR